MHSSHPIVVHAQNNLENDECLRVKAKYPCYGISPVSSLVLIDYPLRTSNRSLERISGYVFHLRYLEPFTIKLGEDIADPNHDTTSGSSGLEKEIEDLNSATNCSKHISQRVVPGV